ncbi:uncharacterized protein BDZ99DRAFT_157646 [Mytilinidion resinicola]|uniref:Peptidase S8/S53 domain-containing protein n=1 Tax=Mytilinidion resinicola TaxID=574789 RepID=A0A6A6Y5D2_9PEZI|nr:uncharacterized protein BDZ99DRAFT_157646 [Mytilinidion resinicola]KAF2804002.1 hypothetical protein BDZ99DRAFT_157646 [Mytilinidion resinicola]
MRALVAILLLSLQTRWVRGLTTPTLKARYHRPEGVELLDDEYIVLLRPGYTIEADCECIGRDLQKDRSFHHLDSINGYTAQLNSNTVHDLIRNDPGVRLVEHGFKVQNVQPVRTNSSENVDDASPRAKSKHTKRWDIHHLQYYWWHNIQISVEQKIDPLPDSGNVDVLKGAGTGAVIYVFDTGIQIDHGWFRKDQARDFNLPDPSQPSFAYEDMKDHHGHGIHVAGIVVQAAPWSIVVNVKAMNGDGEGEYPGTLRALNDVITEHKMSKPKARLVARFRDQHVSRNT